MHVLRSFCLVRPILQVFTKLEFSRKLFEQFSNFMKIRPVGTELFRADGQTWWSCSHFCERGRKAFEKIRV